MPKAEYRTLTLPRPTAQLVAIGAIQVIPLLNQHTTWRGRLLIHAGASWDRQYEADAAEHDIGADAARGFLALTRLVDVHDPAQLQACCGCPNADRIRDRVHWVVRHPLTFAAPVPGRGRNGLFPPPPEVATLAETLIAARCRRSGRKPARMAMSDAVVLPCAVLPCAVRGGVR
jgi:hypothetical protein